MADPSDASALCTACGLCCNGVLFDDARAEPEEAPRIAAAGLELVERGDRLGFALPCRHLCDTHCTIYSERFTICRSFECKLLRALADGEIDIDTALARVATAKALLQKVTAIDPGANIRKERQRAAVTARAAMAQRGPDAPSAQQLYLNMVALEAYLNRYFRKTDAETLLG
jgi:hypothetical protein